MSLQLPEVEILKLKPYQIYPSGDELKSALEHKVAPLIHRQTKVASIGSCFARNLSFWLEDNGYNYIRRGVTPVAIHSSADWGKIYTTASLLQELRRAAHDEFHPFESYWPIKNGRYMDPYRKGIVWSNKNYIPTALTSHRDIARGVIEDADVFIMTVGLTESWYSKKDSATFYQVPPKSVFDSSKHGFRNLSYDENSDILMDCVEAVHHINPDCQIILTVSPVPLRATFRDMPVMVANAESKAILRTVVGTVVEKYNYVHYFPAYEYVTTVANEPFGEDNRHVRAPVIEAVMQCFIRIFDKPSERPMDARQPVLSEAL